MKETLAHGSMILEHATSLNMKTDLICRGCDHGFAEDQECPSGRWMTAPQ
jgi:hypothetical protein